MAFNSESRIPVELYSPIIGYVDDKATLLSMLVSSKAMYSDVESKIYRSVEFRYQSDEKHIIFLKSVLDTNRAHLPGLIHQYSCVSIMGSRLNTTLFNLIKKALVTFKNLKCLRFVIASNEETFTSLLPLKNPSFKLDDFHWVSRTLAKPAHYDTALLHFLSTQRSLKTLLLYHPNPKLLETSLRNLRNLDNVYCNAALLPFLPRSVPIKRLHLKPPFNNCIDHFPPLADLRVLSFSAYVPCRLLSTATERFQTVEVLALHSIKPEDLPDLYRFPLRTLVFEMMANYPSLYKEMFQNMKRLRQIFVFVRATSPSEKFSSRYLRWDRDAEAAILVKGDVVETNWWYRLS